MGYIKILDESVSNIIAAGGGGGKPPPQDKGKSEKYLVSKTGGH